MDIHLELNKVCILHRFGNNIFSGHEAVRNQPDPDVYLDATAAMAVAIACCAIVEDTVSGGKAGAAAGATVFAYVPLDRKQGNLDAFRRAGAHCVFNDMGALPMLLASAAPSINCNSSESLY